jgi:hypothetical protein
MVSIARPDFLYRQIEVTTKIILESVLSQEDIEKVEENCTKYEVRNITPQQAYNGMGEARNYLQNKMCEEAIMIDQLKVPMLKEREATKELIEEQQETTPSQLAKTYKELFRKRERKIWSAYFILKKECNEIKFRKGKKQKQTHEGRKAQRKIKVEGEEGSYKIFNDDREENIIQENEVIGINEIPPMKEEEKTKAKKKVRQRLRRQGKRKKKKEKKESEEANKYSELMEERQPIENNEEEQGKRKELIESIERQMARFCEIIKEKEREENEEKRQKKLKKMEGEYDYYLNRAWKEEFTIENYQRLQLLENMYNRHKPQVIEKIRSMIDEIKNMIMTQTEESGNYFCRIWKEEINEALERSMEET